jgi:hypothetical protein
MIIFQKKTIVLYFFRVTIFPEIQNGGQIKMADKSKWRI